MKKYTFGALFFVLFFVGSIHAQTDLSLSEAIEIALKKNYSIRIERQNTEIAKNNNSWGQAGRYPRVTVELGQNNSLRHTANPASFLQGNVLNNDIQPAINLNWTLFGGLTVNITKERLAQLEQQAQGNTESVIQNTIQSVMLAYYRAVLEQQRLRITKQALDLSRDKYDYLKLKKELGSAVTTDVLLEKSNYLTDSSRYVNQQIVFRNAVRELGVLLVEENPNQIRNLTDTLQDMTDMYDYEELRDKMLVENIDLKTLQFSQNALHQDVQLRQAQRLPTLSMIATSNYNAGRQDLTGATFIDGSSGGVSIATSNTAVVGLTLSVPILNNGNIQRGIQNAVIQEKIGQLRIENQRQTLSQNLASALDLYRVRKQLVQIAKQNRETAQINLDLANERFKTGLINSFDYRALQNNLLTASFAEQEAVFNLNDSNITLLRLTGGILQKK